MSDEDDFMGEDEEDYGLVSEISMHCLQLEFIMISAFSIVFVLLNFYFLTGIFGRQQLGARRRSRKSILQQ